MEKTYIWVMLNDKENNEITSHIQLEIFEGRNKYTKAGLFSGPLRRRVINSSCIDIDKNISFLQALSGVIQTGKNKFRISNHAYSQLLMYFKTVKMNTLYYRLSDKKLHHVNSYILDDVSRPSNFVFDPQNGALAFCSIIDYEEKTLNLDVKDNFEPIVRLYFRQEEKYIKCHLYFLYSDIEISFMDSIEQIETSNSLLFRNYLYENKILDYLISLGGNKSVKNEINFLKKHFFTSTLPTLYKSEFELFWGKDNKPVSKYSISCSISYDINWFSVSGNISDGEYEYQLSDLLRMSRGKSYIELNNKVLFIPEELCEISKYRQDGNSIKLSHNNLLQINKIADSFNIDTSTYLKKFLNYSFYDYRLDSELERQLKEYQKDGLRWMLTLTRNGFGGCLADDMGLGKTIQAIAFVCSQERQKSLRTLIIVPKIVLYNWKNEFLKFAPDAEVTLIYGAFNYSSIRDCEKHTIFLTTYDTLLNHNEEFEKVDFGAIVLDEAQYVKNYRTQRYQAIKRLKRQVLFALTGTPIENSIEELWSLFNLINPGLLGNHSSFMKEYGDTHENQEKMARLKKSITPFFLRRTKEEVLKELPPKTESYIYCEMGEVQRALYEKILVAAQNEINAKPSRFTVKDNAAILQALLYLREACSDPQLLPVGLRSGTPSVTSCKFELFQNYTQRIVEESGKVIVFSQFPRTLKRMENWCIRKGWKTYYIDGETRNREKIIEEFEQSDQGVFLISLKAGGVGLNLVSCQYVLIYEPWWNAAVEQQAANRVYRIGQDKPVFVYHFLTRNTIEEKIYDLQMIKVDLSSGVMEGMNQPTKITMDDLRKIIF